MDLDLIIFSVETESRRDTSACLFTLFFVFWAFYEIALTLSYLLVLPCLSSNENSPCAMSALLTTSCAFKNLDSWIHMVTGLM